MKKILIFIALTWGGCIIIPAQKTNTEISGDILQIALPATALLSTFVWKDEQKSTLQFAKTVGTTIVITHLLKRAIQKPRPYGGNYGFPSGHTSSAFSGAAFIQKRYGWKVGIPAYLLAGYVGWTRVNANKHDYWDVLGGALIGFYTAYIFTKPYRKKALEFSFTKSDQYYLIGFRYKF